MNKTVQLVNAWGEFEDEHPTGALEDFCRYYLAKKSRLPMPGNPAPFSTSAILLRLIGRINKLNMSYANNALNGTGLNQVEELSMLLTIKQGRNPRKTDIIYSNLFELTSGTDMLTRLKKRNLIKEYNDVEDKRSKRVELTQDGENAIAAARMRMGKVAQLMMIDLTEDDQQLCIQLLTKVEVKYSTLWQQHKTKQFDEVFEEIVSKASIFPK